MKKLKVILTGGSGFVGEGVLLECLQQECILEILSISRKPVNIQHHKLKELIVPDFTQLSMFEEHITGYDACFYCAGVSAVGMKEEQYRFITYDTTIAFAETVLEVNPHITFCLVSGRSTDSSGKGKIMWARIKGQTENALMNMPFLREYNFRPGGMIPTPGQQNVTSGYKWIVKLIAWLMPQKVSTLKAVGQAMVNAALYGYHKQTLEVADIKALAAK